MRPPRFSRFPSSKCRHYETIPKLPETKTAQFLIQACVCGPLAPQAATWSLALHLAQGGRCYHYQVPYSTKYQVVQVVLGATCTLHRGQMLSLLAPRALPANTFHSMTPPTSRPQFCQQNFARCTLSTANSLILASNTRPTISAGESVISKVPLSALDKAPRFSIRICRYLDLVV